MARGINQNCNATEIIQPTIQSLNHTFSYVFMALGVDTHTHTQAHAHTYLHESDSTNKAHACYRQVCTRFNKSCVYVLWPIVYQSAFQEAAF